MSRFLHGFLHVLAIAGQIGLQIVLAHYGASATLQGTVAAALSGVQMKLALYNHPQGQ